MRTNLSIIIPLYNNAHNLNRTIDSLLIQKAFFEIILVDDGSKDESTVICDNYVNKNKNIRVIHKKNGGVSSARNAGIDIANGMYVMFVDAGDEIASGALEVLENAVLQNDEPDVISYSFTYCYADINIPAQEVAKEIIINGERAIENFFNNSFYAGNVWQSIYKKTTINNIRFDKNLFMGEDQVFLVDVLKRSKRVVLLPYNFYRYIIEHKSKNIKPCSELAVLNSIDSSIAICEKLFDTVNENNAKDRMTKVVCKSLVEAGSLKQVELFNAIKVKIEAKVLPIIKGHFPYSFFLLAVLHIPYKVAVFLFPLILRIRSIWPKSGSI